MSMLIKYWGTRGSLPSAPMPETWYQDIEKQFNLFFDSGLKEKAQIKEFLKSQGIASVGGFGAATTCAEVMSERTQIIVDGGSGIRNLGEKMMKGAAGRGQAVMHIFLTHFHWDHLLGLPFFAPHFIPGNRINYYAVQPELEDIIKIKFRKPMFPVPFEALSADIKFHRLEPRKPTFIEDIKITPYQLDHPDACWGFRMENGGRVYAHCVDTEGTRVTREALGPDLPLYQNVDLMYFDAQYTLPELAEKANWGHSAAQLGLDIALREKIKSVIFGHHDPGATTEQLHELGKQTKEYYDWKRKTASNNNTILPEVLWQYGYDGLEVDLDKL